eukprot:6313755-Lingulodinium_polyedra.AAC.1
MGSLCCHRRAQTKQAVWQQPAFVPEEQTEVQQPLRCPTAPRWRPDGSCLQLPPSGTARRAWPTYEFPD